MTLPVAMLVLLMATAPVQAIEACSAKRVANCVIDGDTFEWRGQRYRIANIDAPEIGHAQCDAEKRLGGVARRHLVGLLNSGKLKVIPGDPDTGRIRDRHGRVLALVEVDGRDIGEAMIEDDLARPWTGKRQTWCAPYRVKETN